MTQPPSLNILLNLIMPACYISLFMTSNKHLVLGLRDSLLNYFNWDFKLQMQTPSSYSSSRESHFLLAIVCQWHYTHKHLHLISWSYCLDSCHCLWAKGYIIFLHFISNTLLTNYFSIKYIYIYIFHGAHHLWQNGKLHDLLYTMCSLYKKLNSRDGTPLLDPSSYCSLVGALIQYIHLP